MNRSVLWLALAAAIGLLTTPAWADKLGPADFTNCESCHSADSWRQLRSGTRGAIDHAKTGFRLTGRHAGVQCGTCHRPDVNLKDPWPGACRACHADTHHRGANGGDCSRCHTAVGWRIPRVREIHARTRFDLTGAHLATTCTACHKRANLGLFTDAPVACVGCHAADVARTRAPYNHVTGGFSTDCALCHRTTSFYPARFQHDLFFPRVGAHATAACEGCHAGGVYGGTPKNCDACHLASYQATTSPNHVNANFPTDCSQCHTPTGWQPARSGWHDAVFPITRGKHRGVPCTHCHTVPTNFAMFRCTGCHTATKTDPLHGAVGGYTFSDPACYQCHPRGED